MSGKRKKPRASTLRTLSALGVVGLVCLGLAVHAGVGTPSALGIGDIAALCPLGGLEAMIASKAIVPPMLIGLGVVVVLTLLVGRAFCAWGCPVTLMRKVSGRGAGESGASPLAAGGLRVNLAGVRPLGVDLRVPLWRPRKGKADRGVPLRPQRRRRRRGRLLGLPGFLFLARPSSLRPPSGFRCSAWFVRWG